MSSHVTSPAKRAAYTPLVHSSVHSSISYYFRRSGENIIALAGATGLSTQRLSQLLSDPAADATLSELTALAVAFDVMVRDFFRSTP